MGAFDLNVLSSDDVAEPPDEKHFGDLALLRPVSTRPMDGLGLEKFVKGENGFIVTPELQAGLESRINDFFHRRQTEPIPDYMKLPLWKSFEYMVLLVDTEKKEDAKRTAKTNGNNYDWIVGLLLAFRVRTQEGFEFILYDKIGIGKEREGNGYLKELINFARVIDAYLTKKYHPEAKISMPAGLRTSDDSNQGADVKYANKSDIRMIKRVIQGREAINYFVHLFGFLHPVTRQPISPFYSRANEVATYIANLPPTVKNT